VSVFLPVSLGVLCMVAIFLFVSDVVCSGRRIDCFGFCGEEGSLMGRCGMMSETLRLNAITDNERK
jgi:hypothetical protein